MTVINMRFYAVILGYYLLIAASGAMAAEITAVDTAPYVDHSKEILIEGPIEPGDYDKFEAAVRRAGPSYGHVVLMSQGGDVVEAMKIGLLIRKLRFETETPELFSSPGVPTVSIGCRLAKKGKRSQAKPGVSIQFRPQISRNPNCRCFSACFLIHAAGVTRRGSYLGIHRPYIQPERLKSLPDTNAEKDMKTAENVVRNYLINMDIPRDIINIMMEKSSKNIHILTESQSKRVRGSVPFLEELKIARCKEISPDEEAIYFLLSKKLKPGHALFGKGLGLSPSAQKYLNEQFPERSEAEQKMFKLLDQKWERNFRCGSDLRKEISKKAFSAWVNK